MNNASTDYKAHALTAVKTIAEVADYLSGLQDHEGHLDGDNPAADNEVRAINGAHALVSYARWVSGESDLPVKVVLTDLLGDLMHLGDAFGEDTDQLLMEAGGHHQAEWAGER
ncbi:hypothetical protein [Nocardia alni]|uniref:hypothetical protein n=1 Tax=Nocardia alni TaxID=2815723 RepID=UPI001C219B92|nr:hypothetical protein [Nocardia alni]